MASLPFPILVFRSSLIKDRVTEDLEAFSAFDPTTDARLNSLDALLAEAHTIPEHRVAIKAQTRATDQLTVAREKVLDEVKKLRYFISENFDDDADFNASFQFRYITDVRRNDARLLHLLDGFRQMLPQFAARLATVGYGGVQLQGFEAALADYHTKSLAQAKAKADSLKATARRREISDQLYATISALCAAGKMVFENVPSRYEHYKLIDRPAGTGGEPELGALSLTVSNAQGQPLTGVTFQLLETDFADMTDDQGQGEFEEVPAGSYRLRLTATGFQAHQQDVTIVNGETLELAATLQQE